MATKIYESTNITLVDGTEIYLTPLKIKYLREFMDVFRDIDENEPDRMLHLIKCATVCMKQYYPRIRTIEDFEDNIDVDSMYTILDIGAGIKIKKDKDQEVADAIKGKKEEEDDGRSWDTTDLAALESEAFLIGIWKDYEELETSLSMQELVAIVNKKRELDYSDKKFFAAIQGVDLDKESGNKKEVDPWEAMKARVFSRGATSDPNDIMALQGVNAEKAGFGIGMGLDYEKY